MVTHMPQETQNKTKFGPPAAPSKTLILGAKLIGAGGTKWSVDKGFHTVLKDTSSAELAIEMC